MPLVSMLMVTFLRVFDLPPMPRQPALRQFQELFGAITSVLPWRSSSASSSDCSAGSSPGKSPGNVPAVRLLAPWATRSPSLSDQESW